MLQRRFEFYRCRSNLFQECSIKCSYCDAWFEKAEASMRHCLQFHKNEKASCLQFSSKNGQISYKCRTYKLSGEDLICDLKQLSVSEDSGKIIISPTNTNNEGQVQIKAVNGLKRRENEIFFIISLRDLFNI